VKPLGSTYYLGGWLVLKLLAGSLAKQTLAFYEPALNAVGWIAAAEYAFFASSARFAFITRYFVSSWFTLNHCGSPP